MQAFCAGEGVLPRPGNIKYLALQALSILMQVQMMQCPHNEQDKEAWGRGESHVPEAIKADMPNQWISGYRPRKLLFLLRPDPWLYLRNLLFMMTPF